MTNDDGDDEIRAEHHEVVQLTDVKSESRRDEQKVPQHRAQSGEQQCRPAPQAGGGKNNREQIKQRDSPIASVSKGREANRRYAARNKKREPKIFPRCADETFIDCLALRLGRFVRRDDMDIDVAAVA